MRAIIALVALGWLGCADVPVAPAAEDAPTWHDDVAPIVAARCQGCHAPGQVAGALPLTTAEEAAAWGPRLAEVVREGEMPPWDQAVTGDCPTPWDFLDDPRPTPEERDLLLAWVDAGSPAGEPRPAPPPTSLDPLADANQRLASPAPFTVPGRAEAEDVTICYSLDPGLTELGWLEGVQVEPDQAQVVHHAGVRLDVSAASALLAGEDGWYECTDGDFGVATEYLGTFAAGSGPSLTPEGAAIPIPAGSRLVLSVHYHPVDDAPVDDQTALALRWADAPPARVALLSHWPDPPSAYLEDLLEPDPTDEGEPELRIPAGVADHTETLRVVIPGALEVAYELWQIAAHMHVVGAEARIVAEHADGTETCLLHVPRWDFDWQRIYRYDVAGAHPTLHGGDVVRLECTYDNTLANEQLAMSLAERGLDAPVDVQHGSGTYDEMCMFLLGSLLPEGATTP